MSSEGEAMGVASIINSSGSQSSVDTEENESAYPQDYCSQRGIRAILFIPSASGLRLQV